jgi:hypothetical protein
MLKKQMTRIGVIIVSLAAIVGGGVSQAAQRDVVDVLVVPARQTVIQLAFDIAALRDVALVAYDSDDDAKQPILHVWRENAHEWQRLTIDEYNVGTFCSDTPEEMILVGSDADLPAIVISGARQASKVTRIDSLDLVQIVNTLDKSMHFSKHEWKVLAERHDLKIRDLNSERRRWGRYGRPDKKKIEEQEPATESDVQALEALANANVVAATAEEEGLDLAPEAEADVTTAPPPVLILKDEDKEVSPAVVVAEPSTPALEKGSPAETMAAEDEAIGTILDSVDRVVTAPEDK